LSDGQPQVITTTRGIPICQIGDGQVQGHTTPCAAITAVPTPSVVVPPASQYPDGQIQVTPKPAPSTVATGTAPVSAPVTTGNTTLRTTPGVPTTPVVVPTSAPGTNSAGRVKIGSVAALVAGLVVLIL